MNDLLKQLDKLQRIRIHFDGSLRESRLGDLVQFEQVKTVIGQFIADSSQPCEWRYDDEDDYCWKGSCGTQWRLEDAGPEGHGMKFCPCCGKSLVEIHRSS